MADISNKQEFINMILKQSAENPGLKEKLLKDPKGVFESKLKFKLPENFEIVVHQDTPKKLNLVLPYESDELSEVELSAVSGGSACYDDDCDSIY